MLFSIMHITTREMSEKPCHRNPVACSYAFDHESFRYDSGEMEYWRMLFIDWHGVKNQSIPPGKEKLQCNYLLPFFFFFPFLPPLLCLNSYLNFYFPPPSMVREELEQGRREVGGSNCPNENLTSWLILVFVVANFIPHRCGHEHQQPPSFLSILHEFYLPYLILEFRIMKLWNNRTAFFIGISNVFVLISCLAFPILSMTNMICTSPLRKVIFRQFLVYDSVSTNFLVRYLTNFQCKKLG